MRNAEALEQAQRTFVADLALDDPTVQPADIANLDEITRKTTRAAGREAEGRRRLRQARGFGRRRRSAPPQSGARGRPRRTRRRRRPPGAASAPGAGGRKAATAGAHGRCGSSSAAPVRVPASTTRGRLLRESGRPGRETCLFRRGRRPRVGEPVLPHPCDAASPSLPTQNTPATDLRAARSPMRTGS